MIFKIFKNIQLFMFGEGREDGGWGESLSLTFLQEQNQFFIGNFLNF